VGEYVGHPVSGEGVGPPPPESVKTSSGANVPASLSLDAKVTPSEDSDFIAKVVKSDVPLVNASVTSISCHSQATMSSKEPRRIPTFEFTPLPRLLPVTNVSSH
jgi:hypothetical protein